LLGKINTKNNVVKHCIVSHWTQWIRECKANYLYLVELGIYCCREFHFRNEKKCDSKKVENGDDHCGAWHKMRNVIDWARDNNPLE
jgi:hypothetical protein